MRTNSSSWDGKARCVSKDCKAETSIIKGNVCSEVRQVFSSWAVQTLRLCSGSRHFELEWTVRARSKHTHVTLSLHLALLRHTIDSGT